MDVLSEILKQVGLATGAVTGTYSVATILIEYLRKRGRNKKTAEVLAFLDQLGLKSEGEVRQAVKNWTAPPGFTAAHKDELATLLVNLTRGARFHSTQGTALSSYLRCERLIEDLLRGIQPLRKAGEKIANWELKAFLGMGSFGEVWRAENKLHPDARVFKFFTMPGAREWLEGEAVVLKAVRKHLQDCANVIEYLDVEVDAQPHPYLALEYAAGGSLEDWVLRRPDDRVKLSPFELMRGIVRGMAEAHRNDICHRDLKPANILLAAGNDPVPKVADFGLSTVDGATESQSSTRSQMVLVGTRMYHPPEASDPFRRRHPAQDDVFALGVIWYQVLTGELVRPPYDFAERLTAVEADSRTVRLVSRCLAHPERRYRSAVELYADLDGDTVPGPGEWAVPKGCFDVAGIAREYLAQRGL